MTTNPKKLAKQPEHPLDDLIRTDRIPHIWCPGCGIGTTVNCFTRALVASKINLEKTAIVSGIGCTGRVAGYINLDSFHTTHGRAIPFATGMKLANPDLTSACTRAMATCSPSAATTSCTRPAATWT